MNKLTFILITAIVLATTGVARAELRLANILNDHMVLQQEKPLTIWGWATPGAKVTVTLTESEQEAIAAVGADALRRDTPPVQAKPNEAPKPQVRIQYVQENFPDFSTITAKTKANADGRWSVKLDPLKASFRPKFLCAAAGNDKTALIDVLVGEVWVTAGQSNMAYGGDKTGWINKEGMQLPGVRYAHTGKYSPYQPLEDLPQRVAWLPCDENNARSLSTIPYLYGKYLHRKLQVPVGIINASSGGAHGNFWCSLEEMQSIDFWSVKKMTAIHNEAVAAWENKASRKTILDAYEAKYAAEHAEWKKAADAAKAERKRAPKEPAHKPPSSPRSPYKISCLYNGRIAPIGPLSIRGALYLQGEQQVLTWCITRYEHIFPGIISSFRTAFGDEHLPFGIITLQGAGHNKMPISEIGASNRTAIVREIHYQTHLATPNTGFIVAHDVGRGLHPSWKRPLAERTVHWALRNVYKTIKDESYSVDRIEYENGRAFVYIVKRGERRKRVKGDYEVEIVKNPVKIATWSGNDSQYLGGFLIAGADQRWYPARVQPNNEKAALEVWSDLVDDPIALRYGWASYAVANIGPWENPLPPFRTDDWPVQQSFNIDPELQKKCRAEWYEKLDQGYADMLDRIIRQGSFDAAKSEILLYGNAAKMLTRKADRIDAIVAEMTPDFYDNDKLTPLDYTDWTIRRCNEGRLGKAAEVPAQMDELMQSKQLQKKIDAIRKAVADYRNTVEQLDTE